MDTTQLKSIAVGALTGYWPAHLGLTTDAEKIEWLARQVEEMADDAGSAERLQEEVNRLTDEIAGHVATIKEIRHLVL